MRGAKKHDRAGKRPVWRLGALELAGLTLAAGVVVVAIVIVATDPAPEPLGGPVRTTIAAANAVAPLESGLDLPSPGYGYGFEVSSHDKRWLQVASAPTLEEARVEAAPYRKRFDTTTIFKSENNWYAVVVGVLDRREAEAAMATLKAEGLIPRDAYLTRGARYMEVAE